MRNILIVKRDKLGDLILASFLIREVKRLYPSCDVDLWVTAFTKIVHESNPAVRHCYTIQKVRGLHLTIFRDLYEQLRTLFQLRRTKYDLVLVAGGEYSPKAVRQIRFLKFRHSTAYCPEPMSNRYPQLTHPVASPRQELHEAQRILNLLRSYSPSISASCDIKDRPVVGWAHSVTSAAAAFQAKHKLTPRRYLVIGLGARKAKRQPNAGQVKRWAVWFAREYQLPVVLSYTPRISVDPGYPNDEELAMAIKGLCSDIILMGGSIHEAIGVIRDAYVAVVPDSGLMHAATTGQARVLGLFADPGNAPSPEQWGPVGDGCDVVVAAKTISDLPDEEIFSKLNALVHKHVQWSTVDL